ncbi:hypothetical protein KSC_107460 [Ktedonobacter sp. SOSP1-52]|nr:hypothetical protein KSC_107460 [Ktedonobacter sp. SOSP1-52]
MLAVDVIEPDTLPQGLQLQKEICHRDRLSFLVSLLVSRFSPLVEHFLWHGYAGSFYGRSAVDEQRGRAIVWRQALVR